MRTFFTTLVALVAISVVLFVVTLPPRAAHVDAGAGWDDLRARTVAGAYHVHTTRSDGAGDKASIAAAAARAGLRFVIFTDHGDATRPPDPPVYLSSVLCLDAVEISSDDGHYVALDMPRAPYPLGGSGAAVVEDVHRLGGFGIAAHPDSPKALLRWTDTSSPVDGIEWLNTDSEWRSKPRMQLARAALAYLARPAGALASLLDRPATLDRWDRLAADRPVVAIAGADAHGGFGRRLEDGSRSGVAGIPAYEASFRTFSNAVILERPLTGDAATDGRAVFAAIRAGRLFTTIDALASPGLLDFRLDGSHLVARAAMPRGAQTVLYRAGQELARTDGDLRWDTAGGPGSYRVEVHLATAPGHPPVPWLVSNDVYVGPRIVAAPNPEPQAHSPLLPWPWRIEKDPSSSAILRGQAGGKPGSDPVQASTLVFQLGGGAARSQFVALASDIHDQAFRAIDLGLGADAPMRVSVQVRREDGRRWGRSIYVDPADISAHVDLGSMRPLEPGTGEHPDPKTITSILVVIDLTNASPGHQGTLRVRGAALE